jgi:large subunit ribosomal protein L17
MRSLFKNKSISTTLAKAKEIRRPAEKLITIAKKGDLTSRRLVIARLNDQLIGNELVDVIAPQLKRNSGYLRIERNGFRRGDNAEMATISFVDEIKEKEAKSEPKAKAEPKAKPAKKETK